MLVIDGERVVAEIISMMLRNEGATVGTAGDAATALSVARQYRPDVVVLDPGLPDMDGMRLLRALRENQPGLPALLLHQAGADDDRAGRFCSGDDWLTKPFSLEELLQRVRMTLRRTSTQRFCGPVETVVGDLVVNDDSREVTRAGEFISLSHTEFELLRYLARNARRVVTKRQILGRVWPYDFTGRLSVVELYVSYLRKKVDVGRAPMIHTLRGSGYILRPSI